MCVLAQRFNSVVHVALMTFLRVPLMFLSEKGSSSIAGSHEYDACPRCDRLLPSRGVDALCIFGRCQALLYINARMYVHMQQTWNAMGTEEV